MLQQLHQWILSHKSYALASTAVLAVGLSLGIWLHDTKPRSIQTLHVLLRTDPGAEQQFRALTIPFLEQNPLVKIEYHELFANQWIPGETARIDTWNQDIDLVIGSAAQGRYLCGLGHILCDTQPDLQKGLAEDLQRIASVNGKPVGYPLSYADFLVLFSNTSLLKSLPKGREALASALYDWKMEEPNRIGLGLSSDAFTNQIFLPLPQLSSHQGPGNLPARTLEGYVLLGYYQLDRGLTPYFCDESCVLNLLETGMTPAIVAQSTHLKELSEKLGSKLAMTSVSALGDEAFAPTSSYDGRFAFRAAQSNRPELESLIRFLTGKDAQSKLMNLSGQLAARADAKIEKNGPMSAFLEVLRTQIQPELVQVPSSDFDRFMARHSEVLALHRNGKLTNQQSADMFLSSLAL